MRNISLYIFLLLVLAISCNSKNEVDPEDAQALLALQDKGAIRIATMPTLDCLPLYVAYERGWLDKDSIKVSFHPFNAHMDIDTALVGGSVDGAFTDVIRTERMIKKGEGKFDYLTSTALQWRLVTNHAARLNRLDQFGDKMVATTRFSATDYLTDKVFNGVKTTSPVYRVQINDVNVRLGMMINNEMDAAWFPEPQATICEGVGEKIVVSPKRDDLKFGVLAFRSKYYENPKNKQLINKLATIYNAACDSLNKYGLQSYSDEIMKYCNTDTAVVNHLPKTVFTHVEKPSEKVLTAVQAYLK